MAIVTRGGIHDPRSAACAISSPAPKKRYQSGPPKITEICNSAAISDSTPAATSQDVPRLGEILFIACMTASACIRQQSSPSDGEAQAIR